MLAHKQKYFTFLLQIFSYLKFSIKHFQSQLPQILKLLTFTQLHQNIINDQYQTTLIKQLFIFILHHIHNPLFQKNGIGGSSHYLIGILQQHKQQIIQQYYLQIAIQQYLLLTQSQQNNTKFINTFSFYPLDIQFKFQLLSTLIINSNFILIKQKQSGNKNVNQQQSTAKSVEQKSKDKIGKVTQVLLLGQDQQKIYFYFDFLPQYVLSYEVGKWELITKEETISLIKKILLLPMSTENLALLQNLSVIVQTYMKQKNQTSPQIRLHKLKQNLKQRQRQRVNILKTKLLDINQRYSIYLQNYDNRCWSYLNQRKQYVEKLKQAQTMEQLLSAFLYFYQHSSNQLYQCLCDDEQAIPQNDFQSFYYKHNKYYCNINLINIKITQIKDNNNFNLRPSQITQKIIKQSSADIYALFEINIILLQQSINLLQQKACRYFERVKQKHKLKIKQQMKRSRIPTIDLRKKKKKMFGVVILDSDDQLSLSATASLRSRDFQSYQYRNIKYSTKKYFLRN